MQARFTYALLKDMARVPFPEDHIFSQTVSGRPKSEVRAGVTSQFLTIRHREVEHPHGVLIQGLAGRRTLSRNAVVAADVHIVSMLPCCVHAPGSQRPVLWVQVLQQLEERHPGAEAYHFIEDKLSTLEKACLLCASGFVMMPRPGRVGIGQRCYGAG